jgi:hypothetical protein
MFTTDNPAPLVRSLLHEVGIRIDPDFPGEVRWLFDGNKGLRLRYQRRSGLTLDQFGELLWSRGITATRPDVNQVTEMLERFLRPAAHDGTRKPKRVRARKAVLTAVELEAERAKRNRLRKLVCEECGQIIRGVVGTEADCRRCHAPFVRVDPTFNEVMNQTAADAPF